MGLLGVAKLKSHYYCGSMLRKIKLFFLLILLSGCVSSSVPPENAPFADSLKLSELVGRYANTGISNSSAPKYYLSKIIWPKENIDHTKINSIEVIQVDDKSLQVTAKSQSKSIKSETFVLGKNFDIKNGSIFLESSANTGIIGNEGPGAIGLGLVRTSEQTVIGIDKQGHGKFLKKKNEAGIVNIGFVLVLTFPVVTSDTVEVRFSRLQP